jgi:hypothetical protein
MKRILATGLLAICAIALSQQEASAWVNARFGVGLNWGYQSGGNNFGWGAFRNGQPPGPDMFYGGPFTPYGPAYPSHAPYQHSHGYAPTYPGSADAAAQVPANATPQRAPLYHGATYQRPGR